MGKKPNADFTNIVDSTKLFEFVKSIRSSKDNWVFPFESSEDIIYTLRCQLAYLFMDALSIRQKATGQGMTDSIQTLKGNALRIFIEKPQYWEYLLFTQILLDDINSLKSLTYDLQYGIGIGEHRQIKTPAEVFDWLSLRIDELKAISSGLERLFNVALLEAVGPAGQSGDAERIVYVARRISAGYEQAIKWAISFNRVNVPDDFKPLVTLASVWPTNIISDIQQFAESVYSELRSEINSLSQKTGMRKLEMTLTLTPPDPNPFNTEMEKLRRQYGVQLH